MADELEPRIDALYALPLERFTPERDALAKELAADGDRAGAARVKALRKPVVAAWAVNALAREDPDGVKALIELGDTLRSAHRRAVSGGDVEPFRAATEERRQLVNELMRKAGSDPRAGGRRHLGDDRRDRGDPGGRNGRRGDGGARPRRPTHQARPAAGDLRRGGAPGARGRAFPSGGTGRATEAQARRRQAAPRALGGRDTGASRGRRRRTRARRDPGPGPPAFGGQGPAAGRGSRAPGRLARAQASGQRAGQAGGSLNRSSLA